MNKSDVLRQKAQAEERLQKIKAKEKELDRREDTRRKIVLGAALIRATKADGTYRNLLRQLAANHVSEKDRALIEDLI